MLKILISLFFLTFSSFSFSAEPITTDITNRYSMINELEGCKIYSADNRGGQQNILYITVCPNKDTNTTFKNEKFNQSVSNISDSVVDKQVINVNGVKYYSEQSLKDLNIFESIEVNGKKYYKLKEN